MPKRSVVSGEKLIQILVSRGYIVARTRGSHVRLYPPSGSGLKKVTVPLHTEVKPGTLSNIMKDAKLTPEDFA